MVYLRNDFIFCVFYFIQCTNGISSNTINTKEDYNLTEIVLSDSGGKYGGNELVVQMTELSVETMLATEPTKLRVKRQGDGGGKYEEAAKMPQVKVLRLMLMFLKNLWAPVYVGGVHPFHHEVPKPIVKLYKDKIVEFFFPKIGEEARSD